MPVKERHDLLAFSTKFLRDYADQTFPGCALEAMCRMGDPAKKIICFARETEIDLIMMPTRGGGTFRRFLLGSVTAKVLDDATCPVWTDAHLDQEGRGTDVVV